MSGIFARMDTLAFAGTLSIAPRTSTNGVPSVITTLRETESLKNHVTRSYTLTSDSPVSVDLTGFAGANFLHVAVVEGQRKIRLQLTSAEGSAQAVPVDGMFLLLSREVGVTALSITRSAGVETTVQVTVGELL